MDTDIIPPNRKPISGPVPEPPAPEPTPIISSEPETPNTAPTEQPKKKSNVLTLLLIFIALCGIAFGIYGMFLQTPKEKVVYKDNETKCEEIKTPSKDADPLGENEFYFYLGELGVKVSTPEEYKGKLSYLYNNNGNVLIWGYKDAEKPDFANPLSENSYPLLAITSSIDAFSDEKYSFESGEEIFTTKSGTTLYYHITNFDNSDQKDTLLNLALELKLFFVDTYKYSNI